LVRKMTPRSAVPDTRESMPRGRVDCNIGRDAVASIGRSKYAGRGIGVRGVGGDDARDE
jgi:hypothetical protein